jgi:hypothetical protein
MKKLMLWSGLASPGHGPIRGSPLNFAGMRACAVSSVPHHIASFERRRGIVAAAGVRNDRQRTVPFEDIRRPRGEIDVGLLADGVLSGVAFFVVPRSRKVCRLPDCLRYRYSKICPFAIS